jgi:hypothetical protein
LAICAFSVAAMHRPSSTAPALGTTTATTASPKSGCGTPTTADFGHAGHVVDAGFDLGRVDVVAAADDQVLAAADDGDIAVGIHAADVAGLEPAIGGEFVAVFSGMRQ